MTEIAHLRTTGLRVALQVTTLARTVYDLARTEDQLVSVPTADAALRDGRSNRTDWTAAVHRASGRPGSAIARQVMAFADARATTVSQSVVRVMMARLGLPHPELDATVRHPFGHEIGPIHFSFERQRTVAMVLEGQDHQNHGPALDQVGFTDALRHSGWSVAWLAGPDLFDESRLLHRITAAFALSGHMRWSAVPPMLLPGRVPTMWEARFST